MHCMQYATDIELHVHTYAVGAADMVARESSPRIRLVANHVVSLAARNPCISRAHVGIIITLTHRQSSRRHSQSSRQHHQSSHGRRRMAIGTWHDQ